jgi:hypothetical protein
MSLYHAKTIEASIERYDFNDPLMGHTPPEVGQTRPIWRFRNSQTNIRLPCDKVC